MVKKPITLLGAGSWGTALAILLARNGETVYLWDRDPAHIANLQREHCNNRYLPNIPLPDQVIPIAELSAAVDDVQDIFVAVPSYGFKKMIEQLHVLRQKKNIRIAWGTKGIDPDTHQLLHQSVQSIWGEIPLAILSGPSFAKEVALGLPTAVTIASNDTDFQASLTARFHCPLFRVYKSDDLIGVQLGGAVKNIIAIAVGASDGLGFGANARCALITRGLAEMARLGVALGAKQETFMGLAGVGDLVLTATDDQSRNRRFGKALGITQDLQAAKAEIQQAVEGAANAATVFALAQQWHVHMPIVETVYQVIYKNLPIEKAVKLLLERGTKAED